MGIFLCDMTNTTKGVFGRWEKEILLLNRETVIFQLFE